MGSPKHIIILPTLSGASDIPFVSSRDLSAPSPPRQDFGAASLTDPWAGWWSDEPHSAACLEAVSSPYPSRCAS